MAIAIPHLQQIYAACVQISTFAMDESVGWLEQAGINLRFLAWGGGGGGGRKLDSSLLLWGNWRWFFYSLGNCGEGLGGGGGGKLPLCPPSLD